MAADLASGGHDSPRVGRACLELMWEGRTGQRGSGLAAQKRGLATNELCDSGLNLSRGQVVDSCRHVGKR
eukprot:scaffold1012_cov418-Prasinococcus_capsulatus_cf.AAC.1